MKKYNFIHDDSELIFVQPDMPDVDYESAEPAPAAVEARPEPIHSEKPAKNPFFEAAESADDNSATTEEPATASAKNPFFQAAEENSDSDTLVTFDFDEIETSETKPAPVISDKAEPSPVESNGEPEKNALPVNPFFQDTAENTETEGHETDPYTYDSDDETVREGGGPLKLILIIVGVLAISVAAYFVIPMLISDGDSSDSDIIATPNEQTTVDSTKTRTAPPPTYTAAQSRAIQSRIWQLTQLTDLLRSSSTTSVLQSANLSATGFVIEIRSRTANPIAEATAKLRRSEADVDVIKNDRVQGQESVTFELKPLSANTDPVNLKRISNVSELFSGSDLRQLRRENVTAAGQTITDVLVTGSAAQFAAFFQSANGFANFSVVKVSMVRQPATTRPVFQGTIRLTVFQ